MNEETLGETVLQIVVMIIIALVVALMVMAGAGIHLVPPQKEQKQSKPAVHVTGAPKDHPKHETGGPGP
jgi:flagellar basal body-associated protein FliL